MNSSFKLNTQKKSRFFHQFAALLNSGIGLNQSLNLLSKDSDRAFQNYLAKVASMVATGQSLAVALTTAGAGMNHRYFDDWTISLIGLAEYSGSLSETFRRLAIAAENQQRRERMYRSVKISMLAITWSLLLLGPAIFNNQRNNLIQPIFWLNALQIGLLLFALNIIASRYRGEWLQRLFAGIPYLGKITEAYSILYLAEIELPLSCGVPIVAALDLVRSRIPDPIMSAKIASASKAIRAGNTLSQSLMGKLPPIAIQMIRTGEETGNLDAAFQRLTVYYEGELDRSIQQLQGILRPLSILAIGALVAVLGIGALSSLIKYLPG